MTEKHLNDMRVNNLEGNVLTIQKVTNPDREKLEQGLAKLVLTLVQTITEVLERQAIRKVESGRLTSAEVERLGVAFMQIRDRTSDIAAKFGLEKGELSLNLSTPQGEKQLTLVDVIDKLIAEGTVIAGDVSLGVAGIDLAKLRLMATLTME
ncbi:MAG TPA: gas vesicle protein K [Nitrososphaera sp.]|nr:gas vesicle protein K [Nitrososphaera sp.]